MPELLRVRNLKFYFVSNDYGEPPHVHVRRGRDHCKWWLKPRIRLQKQHGFRSHELRLIGKIIREHSDFFEEAWHDYFED